MKNAITVSLLFLTAFLSAQTSSFVTDRLRAAEYFRIGANSSQKVTGFNTSISGAGSNEKLPTTKAVVDYLTAGFVPIGYYSEGTGIDITGGVITNTAPDQTVTMTDGTGIDVTGTYPNFTVTNTAPNVVQTLSIAGQDLTLSGGGGTVEIPNIYTVDGTINANRVVNLDEKTIEFSGSFSDHGATTYNSLKVGAGQITFNIEDVNSQTDFFGSAGSAAFLVTDVATGDATSFLIENGAIKLASAVDNWHGAEYLFEYPDILTNDRSIPDVGLTKSLIASENGALGAGFTDGGGAGTIPGTTTATLETDGAFSINYNNTNPALQVSETEQGSTLWSPDGGSKVAIGNGVASLNAGSVLFNIDAGSNTINFETPVVSDLYSQFGASPSGMYFDWSGLYGINFSSSGAILGDANASPKGFEYAGDYSATLKANARSIPDVGTVNLLKQTLVSYTTTQRNAISSPAAGYIIYCSDCPATDSSTGVQQVYNGSTWKNAW